VIGPMPDIGSHMVALGERVLWGVASSAVLLVAFAVAAGILIHRGRR
jgi:hypothetical protein